jgi:hypothetical protein
MKKLEVQTKNQLWKLDMQKSAKKRHAMKTTTKKESKEKTLTALDKSINRVQTIIEELKKRFKK